MPAGASQEPGTTVQAVVLDVNKKDGIVDLSLQPALVQRAQAAAAAASAEQQQQQPKKKQKQKKGAAAAAAEAAPQLQEGQQVQARIQLVSGLNEVLWLQQFEPQPAPGLGTSPARSSTPAQPPCGVIPAVPATCGWELPHSSPLLTSRTPG